MKKNIYTLLSHLATWIVLFLLPMTFEELQFPSILIPTAGIIVVFYLNYLWLTPNFYMKNHKALCWIANTVIVTAIAIALHHWLQVGPFYFFNLAVAAMIANSMRIAIYWQQAEEARLEAEKARADAELSNLRYQTNPHFLLNTLNNIYALTAFDTRRAQEAIQKLSGLLRHILYESQEQEVSIGSEVDFVQNYVELMKIRLPENVEVSLETSLDHSDAKIAPLILIPLVENAFKHGVSMTKPSFIHIKIELTGRRLQCSIKNSNYQKTNDDRSGHGIGLSQVQRRLDLAYPGRYSWQYGLYDGKHTYSSDISIILN